MWNFEPRLSIIDLGCNIAISRLMPTMKLKNFISTSVVDFEQRRFHYHCSLNTVISPRACWRWRRATPVTVHISSQNSYLHLWKVLFGYVLILCNSTTLTGPGENSLLASKVFDLDYAYIFESQTQQPGHS